VAILEQMGEAEIGGSPAFFACYFTRASLSFFLAGCRFEGHRIEKESAP